MNRSYKLIAIYFIVLSLLITGCGAGQVFGPTITPSATATPIPTSTSTPKPTFTPTVTPSSTFTPTPTIPAPDQLSEYFENPRLIYYENFDIFEKNQWGNQECSSVLNSELVYACEYSWLWRKYSIFDGEGVLIDFKFDDQHPKSWWGMNLGSGEFGQDDYRAFGFGHGDNYNIYANITKGTINPYGFPQFSLKPDIWYRLALGIDETGRIALLVWERDNSDALRLKYIHTLGDEWVGLAWIFQMQSAEKSVVYFDNYYQFSFDAVK